MMNVAAIIEEFLKHGVTIRRLIADSRQVRPGDVFVALSGRHADGRHFIEQAVERGAVGVLAESADGVVLPPEGLPLVIAPGLAALLGPLAAEVYQHPAAQLWLAGVTGTNGKTSVSQWIAQAMNTLGHRCAVVGTLGNGFPGELTPGPNTTPDVLTIHAELARYVAAGASACAMEVSSIGLDQRRVDSVDFDVAVLTNLTRDHLDYHGSMEDYAAAKEKLFDQVGLRAAVLNLDDAFGRYLAKRLKGRIKTFGYTLTGTDDAGVDELLCAGHLTMTPEGLHFDLRGMAMQARLVGRFNASNLLAVAGALLARGESIAAVADAVARLTPPPGRLQRIALANSEASAAAPLVVVDYAHTPDALEKALAALRETATARGGRLVCLFGCGGDRDPGKRPQMGRVAERGADRVIVTSDNPRGEEPLSIITAIVDGMRDTPCAIIADRAAAVERAICEASPRDVILLAGKGHEDYQEIAGVRHPYSDAAAALDALAGRST